MAPDSKSATFKLRQGIKFHDGNPVTPEDVKFTFEKYRGANAGILHDKTEKVEAKSLLRYDGLTLTESPAADVGEEEVARVLARAALARGKAFFAKDDELDRFLARVKFAASVDDRVTAPDDAMLERALTAACFGKKSFAELRDVSLAHAIAAELGGAAGRLNELAPERITLAGGRSTKVVYEEGAPYIASRLQDFFGMKATPKIGGGKTPLVLHLLAPNQRAVQVTSDLAGFWERHYPSIRKELSRRYPRHAWPENPA